MYGKEQESGILLQRKEEIYAYCVSREVMASIVCGLVRHMMYFVNVINIDM
jgi:hypothetical protein